MLPTPQRPLLYHAPPSFYSQIARLALVEKHVAFDMRIILAGPPTYESYTPEYFALNSGGTVPTLCIGDEVFTDSRDIIGQLDTQFEGPRLSPSDQDAKAEVESWIERGYSISERVLAYSNERQRSLGLRSNRGRARALERRMQSAPELQAVCRAKLADIEQFMADVDDPQTVQLNHDRLRTGLDDLEARLKAQAFVVGNGYSLADTVWTVTVARQFMLGVDPREGRPNVARWYADMKLRRSFVGADVWERLSVWRMPGILFDRIFRRGKTSYTPPSP